MSHWYRDDESSSTGTVFGVLLGAVAGFAIGMVVAQKVGGFSGLTAKLRRRATSELDDEPRAAAEDDDLEDFEEDELESEEYDEGLEERVLEAFRNDPILAERAIDIGSISDGVIELAGWVENEDEAHHAVTIARGVPGVETVVNRVAIGDDERKLDDAARRFEAGDESLTEAQWEGQRVGTGRRRQGTSAEMDRHADPKVPLEERWLGEDAALRDASEDPAVAERRRGKGGVKPVMRADRAAAPRADRVVPENPETA